MFNYKSYLSNRCISDQQIKENEVTFDGFNITIPVFNGDGDKLYNKYRQHPHSKTGIKYWFEKGFSPTLYFGKIKPKGDTIYITESELDCLVLKTQGLPSATSTGGCMKFEIEWVKDYKNIFFVFDGDEPGRNGMIKAMMKLKHSSVSILLPEGIDVTDYFVKGKTMQDFRNLPIVEYTPPQKETKEHYRKTLDDLLLQQRTIEYFNEDKYFLEKLKNKLIEQFHKNNKKKVSKNYSLENNELQNIKNIPITSFYSFDKKNKGISLWFNKKGMVENTPSMQYYEHTNSFYCFSSGNGGSVIDFIMKLKNLNFKEAINFLKQNAK